MFIHFANANDFTHTYHELSIKEKILPYKATAGKIPLKDETGEVEGEIFFTAYTAEGEKRPVTFFFNGGPGGSSTILHLAGFGPKRAAFETEGQSITAPYELVDNEETLLEVSDLVFVDPAGTGYSRCDPEKEWYFYSVDGDANSLVRFIKSYLNVFQRWNSPKYLMGESYGTTRVAVLSDFLSGEGIFLNGICLISSALDFKSFAFSEDNHLPYVMFLPSYTATAWYHNKLGKDFKDLNEALNYSKTFAMNTYLPALMKGDTISEDEKQDIAKTLSELTGISADQYYLYDLKIDDSRYFSDLFGQQKRRIGRMDGREKGEINTHSMNDYLNSSYKDPSVKIASLFTCLMNDYLAQHLEYVEDEPYKVFSSCVNRSWSFSPRSWQFTNVMSYLRRAMLINQNMKVFVANGYFDLATPFFNNEYLFTQIGLSNPNVIQKNYIGGHAMYLDLDTRKQMKQDLVDFYLP